MLNVDFHLHTTESDGLLEPAALVRAVAAVGLDYFSITDHDTMAAYQRHGALLEKFGRRVISGIEVSTNAEGHEVHILGYGLPIGERALDTILSDRMHARRRRAQRVVEKLTHLGVRITMRDVERQATGEMIGRPHIARALVELGVTRDVDAAFERYIGARGEAYVPLTTLTPAQAIRAINENGGVSVLAHPTRNGVEVFIGDLVKHGLRGIEVFSPSHTPHDAERFRALARRHNLVMTAGTDFHRPTESDPYPGCQVDDSDLASFLAALSL